MGVCVECWRQMKIAAKGMCNTCYRNQITVTCRDCGQIRRRESGDRCVNCAGRWRRGVASHELGELHYFGPRVHGPLQGRPMRLGAVEYRALRDVALILSGRKLPPPSTSLPKARGARPLPTGMRGKGNGRSCLDCDRLGAKLRYGNRCGPCYRKLRVAS